MLLFTKELSLSLPRPAGIKWKESEILFFDIETTGLSADISSVYLIGVLYKKENCWQIKQWFADNYISEKEMLTEFFEFLKDFRVLIHFNGTGFDIPYLLKKCAQHRLSYDFSGVESLDLYKESRILKKCFHLKSLKQKSVEAFLGVVREDKFSGGELIQIYSLYMQYKILSKPYEELLQTLLLHNADDLAGLLSCARLLAYPAFFAGGFEIGVCFMNPSVCSIAFSLPAALPVPLSYENEIFSLEAQDEHGHVEIPLYQGELKYFYPNYKEYFYLPKEDCAIHKSVAAYVDKEFKEKARASNCYTKKEGRFLPQKSALFEPCFKDAYKSSLCYLEASEAFLKDKEALHAYVRHLLSSI